MLLSDAMRLAECAQKAGVEVKLRLVEDSVHVYAIFPFLPVSARRQNELDAASHALAAKNIEVLPVMNDLGAAAATGAEDLVRRVLERFGTIDVLVNNAGTVWGATAVGHSPEAWKKVMGLNVDACFFVAREVPQRSMIPNKSGKVINIASIAGLGGPRPDGKLFAVAYNTSKGALITLTQALATEGVSTT